MEEIFHPDANYVWAVEDGIAVLWNDIRFIEDQPIQQPKCLGLNLRKKPAKAHKHKIPIDQGRGCRRY